MVGGQGCVWKQREQRTPQEKKPLSQQQPGVPAERTHETDKGQVGALSATLAECLCFF